MLRTVSLVALVVAVPYVRADGSKPTAAPADPAKHWAFKAPERPSVPEIANHKSQITNRKWSGPPGDRTRDTLIKSQVLYH